MTQEVCAIVGVGPGLGLALGMKFGEEGFKLALIGRNASSLEEYAGALNHAGYEAEAYPVDAGDIDALTATFATIKEKLGAVTVLIYNAAVLKASRGSQLDAGTFSEELKVNVVGALTSVRGVVEDMRLRQQGTILLTGGGLALNPSPEYASLSAGKAALRSLALSLAAELEPVGIHVATVTIGGTIRPNSRFSPERIAEVFWKLHEQPKGQFEREIVYKGQI